MAKRATTAASLSPSRAADFKTCPLLYRFRCVDRLAEPPTPAATRGTLVHAVLDRLFDLPASERSLTAATELVEPEWRKLVDAEPALAELFSSTEDCAQWLNSAHKLLAGYFSLEDPARLEPVEREQLVETTLDTGLLLRGFVDRLDCTPSGEIRVVDYKTGSAPREAFEAKALFQLKFYALIVWRTRGVVPRVLRLLYLGDREVLDYTPDAAELARFERNLHALWSAIERARATRDFRPSPGKLCNWCPHQQHCPAFGGTPPPYPADVADGVPAGVDAAGSSVLFGDDD